jgi:hypothetical protein
MVIPRGSFERLLLLNLLLNLRLGLKGDGCWCLLVNKMKKSDMEHVRPKFQEDQERDEGTDEIIQITKIAAIDANSPPLESTLSTQNYRSCRRKEYCKKMSWYRPRI